MKKSIALLLAAGGLALAAASVALAAKTDGPKPAKATFMTKYDLNKNGKLDADEIAQIKSDFLADPRGDLKRLDADHDGKLSDAEAAVLAGKAQRETGKKPGAKKKKDL
jgi:hypothetical protein